MVATCMTVVHIFSPLIRQPDGVLFMGDAAGFMKGVEPWRGRSGRSRWHGRPAASASRSLFASWSRTPEHQDEGGVCRRLKCSVCRVSVQATAWPPGAADHRQPEMAASPSACYWASRSRRWPGLSTRLRDSASRSSIDASQAPLFQVRCCVVLTPVAERKEEADVSSCCSSGLDLRLDERRRARREDSPIVLGKVDSKSSALFPQCSGRD